MQAPSSPAQPASTAGAAGPTARRLIVGPFNRVEGDLEVRLDVADGQVRSAQVVSPMYRGFEQMLPGRPAADALVVVPRICGICSVSQSVAAALALADAAGLQPPPNGQRAINLMAATENLADHLSHFYLFFMPDFGRAAYAGRPWQAQVLQRYAAAGLAVDGQPALPGSRSRAALAARQRWFTLLGTLGGRWPHTHSIQPGGSTRAVDAAERLRLLAKVHEMRAFVEHTLLGDRIEAVLALPDEAALQAWAAAAPDDGDQASDLRLWLRIAADLRLDQLGRSPGRLISHGAYPLAADQTGRLGSVAADPAVSAAGPWAAGAHHWSRGLWQDGQQLPLDSAAMTEDATFAWLNRADAPGRARHPAQGLTLPDADKPGAYSWNKAPRLAGGVAECGALARQVIAGQPLLRQAFARCGSTVYTRVLARLLEVAALLPLMESWLLALRPREPFHQPGHWPDEASGVGLTEAARGALGHWLRLEGGRLAHYQIVAPTSWNFSPRDGAGTPGALEQALVGAPVGAAEATPVAVQHIVRSFDPCMVCTVH